VSAELFEALSDAGQGDRILIALSSFPSASVAKLSKAPLIRMDALSADQILEEIMKFIKVSIDFFYLTLNLQLFEY
jgi:L-fucose mutarotase/ribose pyranase (RbsD/FucU family)